MSSLESRLLAAEDTFSSALNQGEEAISTFNEQWDALLEDVNAAHESTHIEPKVLTLAHTVALRIAELADTSIQLYNTCDSLTIKLVDELDSMMSDLSLTDSPPPPTRRHSGKPLLRREAASITEHSLSLDETPIANRKRRRISNDECSSPKRTRTDGKASTRVSSPSAPCSISPQPVDYTAASRSRKRRLSDSDTSFSTHPHKRLHVGPRLHAVSDSFVPHRSSKAYPSTPCGSSESSALLLRSSDDCDACLDVQPFDRLYEAFDVPQLDSSTFVDVVQHFDPCSESKTMPSPPSSQPDLDNLAFFITSLFDASVCPSMPTASTLHDICTTDYNWVQDVSDVTSSAPSPDADPQTPSSTSSSDGTPSYPSTPLFNIPIALEPPVYGDLSGLQSCSEDSTGFPSDILHQKSPLCPLDVSDISNSQDVIPLPWYSEQAHSIEGSLTVYSLFDNLDTGVWMSAPPPPYNSAPNLGQGLS